VLLWAVKARPWALTALTLVTLALAFAVAYATRLTLASAVASAVTIAALLAAGGGMVAWFFRRDGGMVLPAPLAGLARSTAREP